MPTKINLNPKNISGKVKESPVIVVLICVFTSFLVGYFTIFTWIKDIRQMRVEIPANELVLQNLRPKVELIRSLNDEDLTTTLSVLERVIPSFPLEWSALSTLEAVANESGVNLGLLTVSGRVSPIELGEGKEELLSLVTIPIDVEGRVPEIIAFLKNVEKAKRVISLSGRSFDFRSDKLSMTAQAYLPYLPVPTDLGEVETKLDQLTVNDQSILALVAKLNQYGVFIEEADLDSSDVVFGNRNPF